MTFKSTRKAKPPCHAHLGCGRCGVAHHAVRPLDTKNELLKESPTVTMA